MMGFQHALSGAAAWMAAVPALDAATAATGPELLLGGVICVGASMLPDLDQANSSIARTYGPITNVLARLFAAVAGGHRNGTHSALGVAGFTGLAWLAAEHGGGLRYVVLWILLGVAMRTAGLNIKTFPGLTALLHAVTMALLTLVVIATGADLTVPLVAGVAIGTAAHVAGDMLTPQGCPLAWPVSKARHGIGLVTTGSRWSSPLVTAALTATCLVLATSLA